MLCVGVPLLALFVLSPIFKLYMLITALALRLARNPVQTLLQANNGRVDLDPFGACALGLATTLVLGCPLVFAGYLGKSTRLGPCLRCCVPPCLAAAIVTHAV